MIHASLATPIENIFWCYSNQKAICHLETARWMPICLHDAGQAPSFTSIQVQPQHVSTLLYTVCLPSSIYTRKLCWIKGHLDAPTSKVETAMSVQACGSGHQNPSGELTCPVLILELAKMHLHTSIGLLSAMYTRGSEIVPNPDPASGLYIVNCKGVAVKASIPEDHIAFQMGEAMQVCSWNVTGHERRMLQNFQFGFWWFVAIRGAELQSVIQKVKFRQLSVVSSSGIEIGCSISASCYPVLLELAIGWCDAGPFWRSPPSYPSLCENGNRRWCSRSSTQYPGNIYAAQVCSQRLIVSHWKASIVPSISLLKIEGSAIISNVCHEVPNLHSCLSNIWRWDEPMDSPQGASSETVGIGQWCQGINFGEFSELTIKNNHAPE